MMRDELNLLATALGTYSPRHDLVAVFDDPARVATALHALHQASFVLALLSPLSPYFLAVTIMVLVLIRKLGPSARPLPSRRLASASPC